VLPIAPMVSANAATAANASVRANGTSWLITIVPPSSRTVGDPQGTSASATSRCHDIRAGDRRGFFFDGSASRPVPRARILSRYIATIVMTKTAAREPDPSSATGDRSAAARLDRTRRASGTADHRSPISPRLSGNHFEATDVGTTYPKPQPVPTTTPAVM
jgi:hypothetical protein